MTHNPSILVIGAGELGTAMLEALAKHPLRSNVSRLSVLLRQATLDSAAPQKRRLTQELRAAGVYFEAADIVAASQAELASIFARYDTVICCTGMYLPAGTQTKLAAAALEGQVARYFPWQYGMDYDVIGAGSSQDLFDEQLAVRKVLRGQQATKWTIVSTGLFMSFLFVKEFGVVDLEGKVVRALGSWENQITVTVPDDIGRVTADIALDPDDLGHGSHVVFCAGDTISYEKLADLLDAHFQTKFRRELWDGEILRKQMEEDPNTMVKYRDTFSHGRGVAWEMDKTVNQKRGIPMTNIRSYLEKVYPRHQE
ncbi:unnamed protein product [Clonostachys chloroleuca]|uniref:NmrA-like domain-containing protein n=1 Tax=Clonostachys chloroleuca TaxID=1926264 RepID=A0AA35Q9Y3_9HYPO|nr:unnamed protein product [Clonostachys chloroleuca]